MFLHTVKKIGGARDDLGRNTKRNRITERSFMCGSSPLRFRKTSLCDVGESFNSNNIDIFSNIIAKNSQNITKCSQLRVVIPTSLVPWVDV